MRFFTRERNAGILLFTLRAATTTCMEDDIRKLQETVMHQQEEISRLSDELYLQQKLLGDLRLLLRSLQSRVEELGDTSAGKEPPPPHY